MRYLVRRIIFYLTAFVATITINFFLPRAMPGNPAEALMSKFGGRLNPLALKSIEIAFGLHEHESIWNQFLQYLGQLMHGNLGTSLAYYPASVSSLIGTALPWTLFLVGLSTIISFVIGIIIGSVSAWRFGGIFDTFMSTFFTFTYAFPYFWIALACLYLIGYLWGIFPISGAYSMDLIPTLSVSFVLNVIRHAILPSLTIIFTSVGYWAVNMRNTTITTLAEDYVTMAEAKGITLRKILLRYAGRNAILPNITGFAMSMGFIVGGAILTEIVFSYPGLGNLLFQAVQQEDYPLIQGILMIISFSVLVANFVADVTYSLLDPRVRVGGNP